MFRTPHCMKLYDNVVFMVSFRREKGSSLTDLWCDIRTYSTDVYKVKLTVKLISLVA